MNSEDKKTAEPKKCKCGGIIISKELPVGWGQIERERCSNPDCPEKKPKENRVGW